MKTNHPISFSCLDIYIFFICASKLIVIGRAPRHGGQVYKYIIYIYVPSGSKQQRNLNSSSPTTPLFTRDSIFCITTENLLIFLYLKVNKQTIIEGCISIFPKVFIEITRGWKAYQPDLWRKRAGFKAGFSVFPSLSLVRHSVQYTN